MPKIDHPRGCRCKDCKGGQYAGGMSDGYFGDGLFFKKLTISKEKKITAYHIASEVQIHSMLTQNDKEGRYVIPLTNVERLVSGGALLQMPSCIPLPQWMQNSGGIGDSGGFAQRLVMCRQLATALEYIHSRGVVHCDMKPDNAVFSRWSNRLIIIDFGLSERLPKGAQSMQVDHTSGTPGRAPPEQASRALYKSIGIFSDIFSLAIVCLEILSDHPYRANLADYKVYVDNPLIRFSTMNYVKEYKQWVSAEFWAQFQGMTRHNPTKRLTIAQVLSSAVFLGEVPGLHGQQTDESSTVSESENLGDGDKDSDFSEVEPDEPAKVDSVPEKVVHDAVKTGKKNAKQIAAQKLKAFNDLKTAFKDHFQFGKTVALCNNCGKAYKYTNPNRIRDMQTHLDRCL